MSKASRLDDVNRFVRDGNRLRDEEIYSNKAMADKLGISEANMSAYLSGNKIPGKDLVEKFFTIFDEDLKKLASLVASQRSFNSDPRSRLDKMVDSHHNLSETMSKQADSHRLLAEAELMQAKNTQEFIVVHTSLFNQVNKENEKQQKGSENPGQGDKESQK